MAKAKKTGTKEWAETSLNIARGCGHGCRYCYARYNLVERFKTIDAEAWPMCRVQAASVHKKYGKFVGTVMFPTAHDIEWHILDDYCHVLDKLLKAGNSVLIVTKPHLECIKIICGKFRALRDQILFRFTMGSANDGVLRFWEPNATLFWERFESLKFARSNGFETSVSCEPFLDNETRMLYELCRPYVTDSFWIGMLRHWDSRVRTEDATPVQLDNYVHPLRALHQPEAISQLYAALKDLPLVQWKDSIRDLVGDGDF